MRCSRRTRCPRSTRRSGRPCGRCATPRSPRTRPRPTRPREFPQASYDALRAADFHAPHIPEEYGGAGADALATAIVIEEVARACASSSLIPAVNKLGTMPLMLAGSEELKKRYLPPVAAGEGMFSYCLSEPEAG